MVTTQTAFGVSAARRSRRAALPLVTSLTCILLATPGGTRAQSDYPFRPGTANADLVAYYYPVPRDSVIMLNTGRTWEFSSLLHVYGAVPGEKFEVTVEARREKAKGEHETLFSRTFAIAKASPPKEFNYVETNGYFRIESRMDHLPVKPTHLTVAVAHGGSRRSRTVECRYHTIKGTIRDIDDKPLKAFLSVGPDEFTSPVTVWSDAGGRFSIDLPERTYNIFYVDDHTYGASTLEMWGWHMIVDRDETFDFVVGNGEV